MAMPDWQRQFITNSWGHAFWEKRLNASVLGFRGHRAVLIVGFDSESATQGNRGWQPWGSVFAAANDFSYLGFFSDLADWYRNPFIADKIAELRAAGYFEGYDRILVTGHSMGGYGALVHGAQLPGAHAAVFSPQTTLERPRAAFDTRFGGAHRLDWGGDSGDAAALVQNFERVNLFVDPAHTLDTAHAARLAGPNVTRFNCLFAGHGTFLFLNRMGIAETLVTQMCLDRLTPGAFYRLYRNRKQMNWYRNQVTGYFRRRRREAMAARFDAAFERLAEETPVSLNQPTARNIL